ncbi:MAG: heavy metal-binding domain-containing protein, partial [Ignavibacteria bacterium]
SEKKSDATEKTPIIREGLIDILSIDQNKDGYVYQCPMDWNVISDKSERCPVCEMKLKKVSIEKARENLRKHSFR